MTDARISYVRLMNGTLPSVGSTDHHLRIRIPVIIGLLELNANDVDTIATVSTRRQTIWHQYLCWRACLNMFTAFCMAPAMMLSMISGMFSLMIRETRALAFS